MFLIKRIVLLMVALFAMMSFSKCSSAKSLEKKPPISLDGAYYQHWVSGVKGGGSGYNIYIPVLSNPDKMQLDSVYFKGRRVKLQLMGESLYVGRFKTQDNSREDMVMSSEPLAEYGNNLPKLPEKVPFELNENECVISFSAGKRTKYFKVENISKKPTKFHQSAPPEK